MGCEVQAAVQMAFSEPPVGGGEDPREALHEIRPVGPSLQQESYMGSDLGDNVLTPDGAGAAESVGFIVWYRRVSASVPGR